MDMREHSSNWPLVLSSSVAGISAAPYLLPAIHIGDPGFALAAHQNAGFAGMLAEKVAKLPVIGHALTAGAWSSTLISGGISLGGWFMGDYISKHYDGQTQLPWGKIIKYAAITTSLLISLPSILSGIAVGVPFLLGLVGATAAASATSAFLVGSLGTIGMTTAAAGAGFAALLPHLLTCGIALLPMVGILAGEQHKETVANRSWAERVQAPQPAPAMEMAR